LSARDRGLAFKWPIARPLLKRRPPLWVTGPSPPRSSQKQTTYGLAVAAASSDPAVAALELTRTCRQDEPQKHHFVSASGEAEPERDVLDGHRFTTEGQVRLIGARIGGDFSLDGAQLVGGNGASLAADGLEVGRDISCSGGFTADGAVRLIGAQSAASSTSMALA